MAYLTDEDEQERDRPQEAGLLGGYLAQKGAASSPSMSAGLASGAIPKIYGTGGSGPSVTGYVNFDRIYAANEATAQRGASQMGLDAQKAAQKAQGGLGGLQQKFSTQSGGQKGYGPSADDAARAKGGGSAFAGSQPAAPTLAAQNVAAARQRQGGAALAPDTRENWLDSMQRQAGHAYGGPSSLQDVEGYKGVLGDYVKAKEAVGGLQDDAHLQALLDKQATGPHIEGGSKLDAALIGAAGRPDFARLTDRYKGLGGELGTATKASVGEANANKAAAFQNAAAHKGLLGEYMAANEPGEPGDDGAPKPKSWKPEGYTDLNSFLGGQQGSVGGVYQDAHNASQQLSPADWITRGLGEAGLNVPMASEAFAGAVAGDAAPKDAWQTSDVRTGMQQVMHEYGMEAAQWLWDNLTPEMWDAWMKLSNPGSVAREMRAMLEANGYAKQPKQRTESPIQQAGQTPGEASQGTTAAEETARTNAYRDGWGSSYDEQFRNGNRNPVAP